MTKFLGLVAIAALLGTPALAADLRMPVKAPPAPPAASWSGCYIDGGVGYGFMRQDSSLTATGAGPFGTLTVAPTSFGGSGWLGRVGAGCDMEIAPRWIIGLFGDFDFSDIHGTMEPFPALGGDEKESSAWAFGGRLGYAVAPNVLSFVDGGFTQAQFDAVTLSSLIGGVPTPPGTVAVPSNRYNGWFLGGGVETSLAGLLTGLPAGLFLRTEYRYADYGTADLAAAAVGATLVVHNHPTVQTVTTSLVWRFNWMGAPARY